MIALDPSAPIFADFRFSFEGRDYVLPSGRVLQAIAALEHRITLHELSRYTQPPRNTVPAATLSYAFAQLIQMAGGDVSAERVYLAMFREHAAARVVQAVQALLVLMTPPQIIEGLAKDQPAPPAPANRAGRRKAASKRSTKP